MFVNPIDWQAVLLALLPTLALAWVSAVLVRRLASSTLHSFIGKTIPSSSSLIRTPLRLVSIVTIEILPDGRTAKSLMHCTVEIETPIGPSCPLVEMAREQGGGVVKRTETGVFENTCVKHDGAWTIERAAYRPALEVIS